MLFASTLLQENSFIYASSSGTYILNFDNPLRLPSRTGVPPLFACPGAGGWAPC
jgi:hypothetical protein